MLGHITVLTLATIQSSQFQDRTLPGDLEVLEYASLQTNDIFQTGR
jgi:hypothetical protein